MDSKRTAVLALLYMSYDFDSINKDMPLEKLIKIGLSPSVVIWFRSYLTGRRQFVRIGSTFSDSLVIKHGVRQGSGMRPPLFDLFINDLQSLQYGVPCG